MTDDQKIQDSIAHYLSVVKGPSGGLLRDEGRIQNWKFACGRVQVDVVSTGLDIPQKRQVDSNLYDGLLALDGVTDVIVNLVNPETASEPQAQPSSPPAAAPQPNPKGAGLPEKKPVPGVKQVIAVASGKGGVGKSTVSVNLAIALQRRGFKVGLLDADCYGPSIPVMLGIGEDEKPRVTESRKISPVHKWDIDVMSIGFFVERDNAVIWRGLMVTKALQQFFFDVAWEDIDFLIIDLPPGTGDTQLTMVQNIEVHGAVIVSTPQDVALADARKGIAMFRETKVPILGLIENMSYFACPHCGETTEIFSRGGARKTADVLGAPFLGEIPLEVALRETSDAGIPLMSKDGETAAHKAFLGVADAVLEELTARDKKKDSGLLSKLVGR
jgi:ATP-binding protein involved in chromosome partitioning